MKGNIKEYVKWILRGEIPTRVLINRGLVVGENFNRQRNCTIDPPHCWLISIGNNVALAPGVHILAHDGSTKQMLGYTKVGRVYIGNNVFIGAETVVLPNVKIGDDCIIGAASVVTKDIPSSSVAVGNPARVIMTTQEYLQKNKEQMNKTNLYDESYTFSENLSLAKKQEMKDDLKEKIGYVV